MSQSRMTAKTKSVDLRPVLWSIGILALITASLFASASRAQEETIVSHGYSFYGNLDYPADYAHFSYVNPDAPKGGEISIGTVGTFDSMNPYSRKGRSGALGSVMYESLLGEGVNQTPAPADVYSQGYGLLAESLEYDEGRNWVIFNMRPEAKFSDGTPLTAHDIRFSHNLLLDEGLKSYADAVRKMIPKVEILNDHKIKFYFAEDISRRSLIELVGGIPAWSKKWYEETGLGLNESRMEVSPGSGAYMIETVDVNRRIVYKRNPGYWGNDLPFNKGRNNFDRIRIEYFGDDTAAFEAFKAGEYTFRQGRNSKKWATAYEFEKVQNGQIVKKSLPNGSPPSPSGFVFNLSSEVLKDSRVRHAIALAYNFEWTNESLQHGLFKQRASFTQDTPLMATGVPEGKELEILKSLGDLVPDEILNEPIKMPHTSSANRLLDRRNIRAASKFLDEAGWAVDASGVRRNAVGEALELSFLYNSSSSDTLNGIVENFISNVDALGAKLKLESVDSSQFTSRRRDRDYDMIFSGYSAFLGTGTSLPQQFGSEDAAYSLFNPAGLASPLVDAVIDASLQVLTREDEVASLMALDRVLRHEFIMIPVWYNADHWVAYYDQYGHPETIPAYGLGYLDFWWFEEDKAAKLRDAGALR
ncbi:MAG: extracellular solute-binding protein [Ascidiaceihabitans sp.]